MLVVHHLENSRSQRVLWLLEELGVPSEVVRYERHKVTMLAPAALKLVHPLGKSPVIVDDGVVVAESGAIVEYLIERYGDGRFAAKPGTPEQRRERYWMHFAEGSLQPLLLLKLVFDKVETATVPFFIKPVVKGIAQKAKGLLVARQLVEHLDFIEQSLQQSLWFAGDDITGADVMMSFPAEAAVARGGLDQSRPKLMAFVARVQARPAWKKALEVGGPYGIPS